MVLTLFFMITKLVSVWCWLKLSNDSHDSLSDGHPAKARATSKGLVNSSHIRNPKKNVIRFKSFNHTPPFPLHTQTHRGARGYVRRTQDIKSNWLPAPEILSRWPEPWLSEYDQYVPSLLATSRASQIHHTAEHVVKCNRIIIIYWHQSNFHME